MKKKLLLLIPCIIFLMANSFACTIFTCAVKGQIFSAANEDDEIAFAKIWFNPPTKERFGSVCFGFGDLQAQAAMNEYGLFFDFTAQYNIDASKVKTRNPYNGDLFFEMLGKCKTVPEALEYLQKYGFASTSSQATISDAEGRAVVINADTMIEKTGNYQVNTNFNIADAATGKYYDHRYDFVKQMLAGATDISVPFIKKVLDCTHQEGGLYTQYSYIFDQKKGLIYVYFFHNYDNVYVIDLKKELKKGYRLENLSDHFPLSFAYETFMKKDPLYRKEKILAEIKSNGMDSVINQYILLLTTARQDSTLPTAMLEVALQLVKNTWNQHSNGGIWQYWFSMAGAYDIRQFKDNRLTQAANILMALLHQPIKDVKLINFMNEIYAYINLVQGNTAVAKAYYEKCVASPGQDYEVTYRRATQMLKSMQAKG